MRKTIILGGGTFNHVRNHFSLAAVAFGSTARALHSKIEGSELYLTKMADPSSRLVTNADIAELIDKLIKDESVGTIIMNCALCDYEGQVGDIPSGSHAERLKTSEGDIQITLTPSDKVIGKIRQQRPDIFLVGFKTTTGYSEEDQYYRALKFMKSTKCNLVLANDTVERRNMVITPEEASYHITHNREEALEGLADMILKRQNLTYHRTVLRGGDNTYLRNTPITFQEVLRFLIDNGGFISDNGNGFTPGHFCYKDSENVFLSSQRKADHNKVFEEGLSLVERYGDRLDVWGSRKPSVGAMSQRLLFDTFPQFDCIVHTHNPIKEGSILPTIEQYAYQCGSLECGRNTLKGIKLFGNIAAVYLNKHGANIMFKSTTPSEEVINFIVENLQLGIKVK